MPHRFAVAAGQILGGRATLTGPSARQIARVLRLRLGDEVILFDEEGTEHTARLLRVTAITPLLLARCVATGPGRLTRRRAIARGAGEQAGRTHLPSIQPPVPLGTFLAGLPSEVVRLALWEGEGGCSLPAIRAEAAPVP